MKITFMRAEHRNIMIGNNSCLDILFYRKFLKYPETLQRLTRRLWFDICCNTFSTDFSVGTTARGSTSRRHSNTPYIKANLNEKENEILLRHMSKASNGAGKVGRVMETQWCHSNDDLVSSV